MPRAAALIVTACAAALAGCQTTYKQVATITPAEGFSAVRFAHGNALLMSEGRAGTVWLKPVRYFRGDKIYFEVVAFNKTSTPINFGTEDIELRAEDGQPLEVHDFDHLQHDARRRAQAQLTAAVALEGLEAWHAERVSHRNPYRAARIWRTAQDQFYANDEAINDELGDSIVRYSQITLQTTTVDPFTSLGGMVFTDRFALPEGGVRELTANVRFAGEDHRFRLRIAPEGVPTPVQVGLPAVERGQIEAAHEKCQTWMWDEPGLPCHAGGLQP